MKKSLFISLLALFVIITAAGCDSMLDKGPLDQATDKTYWTNEKNIETFAWGFYPHFFTGYNSGYAGGKFFTYNGYNKINDTYGYTVPPEFLKHAPTSSGAWNNGFAYIRKANLFINRIENSTVDDDVKKKWTGVGRFFRALEYHRMVRAFGAVPWYSQVIKENEDRKLYKKRTPRVQVADSMLADFQYATKNIPANSDDPQQSVDKYVALAFMSRAMLFQGTYLEYHDSGSKTEAVKLLKAAKDAAEQVMNSGNYSISSKYRKLFNSLDLSGNPDIILYRHYNSGSTTHAMVSYSSYTPQTGVSNNALRSYLCTDGLPPTVSPEYKGDKSINALFSNRDPRMTQTFVQELRLDGEIQNYSTTGISQKKFLNEQIAGTTAGTYAYNYTDAPVMRLGEVLLNYAEATAELANLGQGSFTQSDLDKSINKLRDRPGINMPHLQVVGNMPAVNGKTYDDPKRDPSVSPIIWEIRRERRIELTMEGFRLNDLKRWKKLNYANFNENKEINRGAYIDLNNHPKAKGNVTVTGGGKGYIIPAAAENLRSVKERDYLAPLPTNQITLYKKHDVTLEQNPGW